MIKSITIKTYRGDSVKLELTRPDLSGFIVKSIEGLTPATANINTSDITTSDGGIFNSSRITSRNIVMELEFMQIYRSNGTLLSIEDIRLLSYKYFPVKKNITITVETDRHTLQTEGYVESNEPDIFSQNEGTSVSIICPDPYFYALDTNKTVFSGVDAMFEFPFSNESLTEPLLQMGEIYSSTEQVVYYEGDMDIGLSMYIYANDKVQSVTIRNSRTEEMMFIDTEKLPYIFGVKEVAKLIEVSEDTVYRALKEADEDLPLTDAINSASESLSESTGYSAETIANIFTENRYILPGDTIVINTQVNNKNITLIRDGIHTNILNAVRKGSKWFTLMPGDNIFAYSATYGVEHLDFQIFNKVAYYGV